MDMRGLGKRVQREVSGIELTMDQIRSRAGSKGTRHRLQLRHVLNHSFKHDGRCVRMIAKLCNQRFQRDKSDRRHVDWSEDHLGRLRGLKRRKDAA